MVSAAPGVREHQDSAECAATRCSTRLSAACTTRIPRPGISWWRKPHLFSCPVENGVPQPIDAGRKRRQLWGAAQLFFFRRVVVHLTGVVAGRSAASERRRGNTRFPHKPHDEKQKHTKCDKSQKLNHVSLLQPVPMNIMSLFQ